tara:strand:- start:222 stop:818 length:597 start_codon:yes stop_codon:yes gene_type:complete
MPEFDKNKGFKMEPGYTPFKMKGFSGFVNSPAKQTTDPKKKTTTKTYPTEYTKEDVKFLKEQREDIVRRSDFPEGSKEQKMFDANQAKIKARKAKKKSPNKLASPAKSHKPGHKDQQGPIPKKNIKLQKGEHPATWVYPGGNKQERINDYEDRAEFAREDAFSSKGKKKEMHKKTAKNLEREAEIIRDRRRNTRKNAK